MTNNNHPQPSTLSPKLSRFRLGLAPQLHNGSPDDARSLSRLYGPFNAMAKQDSRLVLVPAPTRWRENGSPQSLAAAWDWFTACDAIYLLDPFSDDDWKTAMFAKLAGCKIWVDYIDDLCNVRVSNPGGAAFVGDAAAVRKSIHSILKLADVATCTTKAIRDSLLDSLAPPRGEGQGEGCPMLLLPESCRWQPFDLPRKKMVSWRGLCSHQEDLESVLPALHNVAHDPAFADWDWLFLGEPGWKITEAIPKERLIVAPTTHPYQFMQIWGGAAPFLHIVPLADNAFNRGKTCLAWMEATAVGAAVIAPGLPEWLRPEIINYQNAALDFKGKVTFESALRLELAQWDDGSFHPKALESRDAIYPALTLETMNQRRWMVLNKLSREAKVESREPELQEVGK